MVETTLEPYRYSRHLDALLALQAIQAALKPNAAHPAKQENTKQKLKR